MKKYAKTHWRPLVLASIFAIVATIFAVRIQFVKGDVLDHALLKDIPNTIKYSALLAIFIVLEIAFFYLYDICRGKFTVDSMREIKSGYFKALISKQYPKFIEKSQGEYLAQYTKEMDIIEKQYFDTIPKLIEIVMKILIVSISLFILDFRIAFITLILLTTPLYVPKLVEKRLQKAQIEFVRQFESHIKLITGWLRGFEIIKNFSVEKNIKEKFNFSNDVTMHKNLEQRHIGHLTRNISAFLSYFSYFIILAFAAYLVLRGDFSAGDFFIAIGMIDQLSYPIISLTYFLQDLVSVRPINESMLSFLKQKTVTCGTLEIPKDEFKEISFKNVSFAYEGHQEILNNLNMTFKKNKQYLIKGISGSGKTTSLNLLLNYFQPTKGSVSINGIPVNEIKNLKEIITIMRQDAILFEDSLRNNVSMYEETPDEKIIEILKMLSLDKYANKEGLDMLINEGGINLSGGEKRRITLARSILRASPIMILDEPLANLDEKKSKLIESQLLKIKDRTLIIISHKFSPENMEKLDEVIIFK